MNGERRLFMTIRPEHKPNRSRALAKALAAAALCAPLGACASIDPFERRADTQSPAANRVDRIAAENLPYPKWSQFPGQPKDVPAQGEFATRVAGLDTSRSQLLGAAAAIHWELHDSEAWAASARSLIDPRLATPAPADAAAQTDAFLKAMKALATPPAPVR